MASIYRGQWANERLAEISRRMPVYKDDPVQMQGLNALIVVIRHMYSCLPEEFRPELADESHLILQISRATCFDEAIPIIKADKLSVMDEICPGWQDHAPESFLSLMTSDVMNEAFWQRDELLLYDTPFYYKPLKKDWEPDPLPADRLAIAKASTIECHDGEPDRDSRLCDLINPIFRYPHQIGHGWYCLPVPDWPVILRVKYPYYGTGIALTGLRALELCAPQLDDNGTMLNFSRHRTQWYQLIAAVRLRGSPEALDLVSLFRNDGSDIKVSEDVKFLIRHSCMLFYIRTAQTEPSNPSNPSNPSDFRRRRAEPPPL
ncbi:hypothetical protein F5Y18DRAFT_440484 [Xylariaceae sp. FL1019]|nr:hypothetical protein F5Y18DRAFT_440484 [Xylariaceae sp. FL1019]